MARILDETGDLSGRARCDFGCGFRCGLPIARGHDDPGREIKDFPGLSFMVLAARLIPRDSSAFDAGASESSPGSASSLPDALIWITVGSA